MPGKVAVITGGNAGIGLTLAERLLSEHKGLQLCLASRNKSRLQAARDALQLSHPGSRIETVILDTSSVVSVNRAAMEIREMFSHIDFLYLNAGIMPVSTVDWDNFWKGLFSSKIGHMFTTGEGLLKQVDEDTDEGLRKIFATNLFGHFVLVKELLSCLGGADQTSQIVWTSSSNAKPQAFNIDDIQHKNGSEPYASSKYGADVISVGVNDRFNNQGIYSHSTCPGLVMTKLTYGILPAWFWTLILPIFLLLRVITASMNYSTYNGSEALVWLSHQNPATLDPRSKYLSRVNLFNKRYVESEKMNIEPAVSNVLYDKLEKLESQLKKEYHIK